MRLKTTFGNWFNDIPFFLRLPLSRSKKMRILLTFIRISFIYVIYIRAFRRRHMHIRFLGFDVYGFDYETMYYLFEEIFVRGEYAFITQSENPRILDCGANIGYATLFLKWQYPNATIDSFEPDPAAFSMLEKNITKNKLTNVRLHNTALSATEGTTSFFVDANLEGSLSMSTHPERVSSKRIEVRTETLVGYLSEGVVDFLKLDVEGAEAEIIKHLDKLSLFSQIRSMAIEYHHHIGSSPSCLGEFLTILERNGFEYQINARSIPICTGDKFQDINIFCYRKK
jgi:FkbM family methyltransferase